jgi:tripartite motif-containing protein 71
MMESNTPVTYVKTIGKDLIGPYGITVDGPDTIWVAEAGGGKVTQLDVNGNRLKSIGRGQGGLFKKVGRLRQPAGVTRDKLGNCYVADFKLNKIFKYDQQGQFIKAFGSHGRGDGQFSHCWSIKCDPEGNLWVADKDNNRLQKFDREGNFLAKIGKESQYYGGTVGGFKYPSDMAFDNEGFVFVTDEQNCRVLRFDPQGNFISKFGKPGKDPGQFSNPRGITIDNQQRIYVTDAYLDAILVFNISGHYLYSFTGPIQVGGSLYRPIGIAINDQGMIFVSDNRNHRIMVFSTQ